MIVRVVSKDEYDQEKVVLINTDNIAYIEPYESPHDFMNSYSTFTSTYCEDQTIIRFVGGSSVTVNICVDDLAASLFGIDVGEPEDRSALDD